MVQCSVKGCRSRSDVHSILQDSVHFHRIPKNPEIRIKWMRAINKVEVSESTRVCSKHFTTGNFYTTANGFRKLIVAAIPDKDLENDINEISAEDISQPSFIKTQFPRPRILKVTRFPLPQQNSNKSQGSLRPNSNKAIRMPEIRIRLDPNEVRKKIGKTAQVATVDLEKNIMPEFENIPPEQQKPMETDPLQINTENKIRTPQERKLFQEVKKLRDLNQKRLEALKCLEEQNRRLLKRNDYLQYKLDKCQQPPEVSKVAAQDFVFFS